LKTGEATMSLVAGASMQELNSEKRMAAVFRGRKDELPDRHLGWKQTVFEHLAVKRRPFRIFSPF